MEVLGAALLYTLATLAVTFAGFAALLLIIRQSSGTTLSALDRFLTRTVVGHFFWLAAGATFPSLLALYGLSAPSVWKIAALLFGVPMLALLVTFSRRRLVATGMKVPPRILVIMIGLGSLAVAAMIVAIFANFAHPAAAYATAITVNLTAHVYAFVTALEVILQQGGKDAPLK